MLEAFLFLKHVTCGCGLLVSAMALYLFIVQWIWIGGLFFFLARWLKLALWLRVGLLWWSFFLVVSKHCCGFDMVWMGVLETG